MQPVDILIIGAGSSGMPCAIHAGEAGASVCIIDIADEIGGTLHIAAGQMSAAGTRLQEMRGIVDSPELHLADVMRISRGTADPQFVDRFTRNAADTLHWLLDNGLELHPAHPIIFHGHEAYETARTYWGPKWGISILEVIRPLFEQALEKYDITLHLQTSLVRLVRDAKGAVTGAVVSSQGVERLIEARSVVLSSGGYVANAALRAELTGRDHPGLAYAHSQGKGLLAAVDVGAAIINQDKFLPGFAGVPHPNQPGVVTILTDTTPQSRQPWEIYVDCRGSRFMAEDNPSVDGRERALLALPEMAFWMIYNQAIRDAAPQLFNQEELTPGDIERAFEDALPGFVKAASLGELADRCGLDEPTLVSSIARYNRSVAGEPDPSGRLYKPAAIESGPYYAVRHEGMSVVGFAGLATTLDNQVLDQAGESIEGLFAVGEIVGLGRTCGNAYVGGMSVTPALTFGRLLGSSLGRHFASC